MRWKSEIVIPLIVLIALCAFWLYAKSARTTSASENVARSADSPAPPSADVQPAQGPAESPVAQQHQSDSRRITVTVKCIGYSNAAVPDLKIQCRIATVGGHVADLNHEAVADSEGIVQLQCDRGQRVRIELADNQWFAPPLEMICAQDQSVELRVMRAGTVRIRAEYDDGVPVTGLGELAEPSGLQFVRGGGPTVNQTQGYATTFALSDDGTVSVPRVPLERALECVLFCKRSGYQKFIQRLEPRQLSGESEIRLVVARTFDAGGLRVTFGESRKLNGCRLLLEAEAGGQSIVPLSGAEMTRWESGRLKPNGRYRVSVIGPLAGRSDWVTVLPGQVTEVNLALAAGGAVKARLVDEAGKPVVNGCANMGSGLVSYTDGRPRLDDALISDVAGIVEVRGLPAGRLLMSAEAWGYQAAQFEADVLSGEVTDVGDVILRPATGEITVVLTGTAEGRRYRVGIGQRVSTFVVVPPPVVEGNTYLLKGLSLRQYIVAIALEAGGSAVSREVNLTERYPTQTVYIDVAGLQP